MTKAVTTSGGNVQTAVVYSYDSMGRPTDYWQCAPRNCGSASIWSMTRVAHVPAVLAGMYATQGRYNLRGWRMASYAMGAGHGAAIPGCLAGQSSPDAQFDLARSQNAGIVLIWKAVLEGVVKGVGALAPT